MSATVQALVKSNEAKTFARDILRSEKYKKTLRVRAENGTLPAAVEQMLWHYAYGKPVEQIEVRGLGADLSALSEEELAQRAEILAVGLRLVKGRREDPASEDPLDHAKPVSASA